MSTSYIYNKLCSSLLYEYFGSIVHRIGSELIENGPSTLTSICFATELLLTKVQEGLHILIKYGFVTYSKCQQMALYSIQRDKIIMILRYARFMLHVKTYCGDEGEIMLEQVLRHGYITASELIIKSYKRIEKSPCTMQLNISKLKNTFELLVKNQFLMRSLSFETVTEENVKPDFHVPTLNLQTISSLLKKQDCDPGDRNIYWKVNFDRFTQDLRDQIVISAITRRLDANAGELMRLLINMMYLRTASWADTSNPIPFTEIKEAVRKTNYADLEQFLDQYLRLIEEDANQFIQRVGDSGGGQYIVNMKNAFDKLAWATLENIVLHKFDSKAARIFRLVREKSNVDLEQIQQTAMISSKMTKLKTHSLEKENYIQVREVKKNVPGTSKNLFVYYVDLDEIIEMEVNHCYHALYNSIKRREHESTSNKRMIEKQIRVQIISTHLKEYGATEQQLADVAEMMTPSERQQLEKVQISIKKLSGAELLIDSTLFILQMYQVYHKLLFV